MSEANPTKPACIHCEKDGDSAILVALYYKGHDLWICSEHVPILIHKPHELASKLPSMENIKPG